MAQPLNHKEEKFKNILGNIDVKLDNEALWEVVGTALQDPPKKKRRFVFIWWLVGLLFLSVIGFIVLNKTNNSKTHAATVTKLKSNKAANHDVNIKDLGIESNSTSQLNDQEKFINKTPLTTNIEKKSNTKPFKISQSLSTNTQDQEKHSTLQNKVAAKESFTLVNQSEQPTPTALDFKLLNINELPGISAGLFAINNFHVVSPRVEVLKTPAAKFQSYYSIGIGTCFTNPRVNGNIIELSSKLENQLVKQTSLPGFQSELAYHIETRNHWRLSLGLNYSQSILRYRDQSEQITSTGSNGITQINIDEYGFVSNETGPIEISNITNNDINWHHRIHSLDSKLELSKSLFRYNNWSMYGGASLSYNILSKQDGYFFNENYEFIKTNEADSTPFNKSQNLAYGFLMSLEYQIDKLTIGLSPSATWWTGNMLTNNYPYKMKNSQYGIQVRLYYSPTWE